jgi:N-acetylneuraminate synthase/sialic acid synthase
VEAKPLEKMGKKLVAARALPQGHVLSSDDVAIKSPADGGLPPYELDRIVGMRLRRAVGEDETLELADVEAVAEPLAAAQQ